MVTQVLNSLDELRITKYRERKEFILLLKIVMYVITDVKVLWGN